MSEKPKAKIVRSMTALNLQVIMMKEGDMFVPYLPALDITSAGDTLEEAMKNIVEAAHLFVETCMQMGTLQKVLQDCGWKAVKIKHRKSFVPPHVVGSFEAPISIPA